MHKLKNEEPNFCKDCVKHLVKDGIHTCSPQLIKAAIEATKEKAAKVCEHNKHRQSSHDDEYATGYVDASLDCAAAIRNMK
jgi:hypothetical protein